MTSRARDFILYTIYPQLDALGVDGVSRLLGSFAGIEEEARRVTAAAYDAYVARPGDGDIAASAERAEAQGAQYYIALSDLRQSVINLLAVGLYHQFEQHWGQLRALAERAGIAIPDKAAFPNWADLDELRLLANTAKHADGGSATQLRERRGEFFLPPGDPDRDSGQAVVARPLVNPLGGTDFFVLPADIERYRDSIRSFWEDVLERV